MEHRVEKKADYQHKKNVLYLSQRDLRVQNNYSLYLAYTLSEQTKSRLFAATDFSKMKKNKLQEAFMIEGMKELYHEYKKICIEYYIIEKMDEFILDHEIDCIVTEFSPIKEVLQIQEQIRKDCQNKKIAFYVCDSHNFMPCKMIGEYVKNFRGLKTRFYKQWDKYYRMHPELKIHEVNKKANEKTKNQKTNKNKGYFTFENYKFPKIDNYTQFKGGYSNAVKELEYFINKQLSIYNKLREKPTGEILRTVAPWIENGQISIYEVLSKIIKKEGMDSSNVERYVTELVMWRQTADHFCFYEKNYDSIDCALPWAKETLQSHNDDKRDHNYALKDLEKAHTDNEEWNAAQNEMLMTGQMHQYVRFFWAKKILIWAKDAEQAIEYANNLVNSFSFDGNQPTGYLNTMYSICGTMDQGWRETNIRGKIRGMDSVKSKEYVKKWSK